MADTVTSAVCAFPSISTSVRLIPRAVAVFAAVLALGIFGPPSIAEASPAAQSAVTVHIDSIDARAHPDVTASIVVRGASGVPVAGLGPAAFAITEDANASPLTPTAVGEVADAARPTALVLALDISGSMTGQPLADLKAAALGLIGALGPADEIAVVAFADTVALEGEPLPLDPARELDFTGDRTALQAVVEGLSAGGNTPLYDAASKAVRLAAARPGGAAVLLFTDGRDEVAGGPPGSGSTVSNEDSPVRAANQERVPIFTVGLGNARDDAWLRRVALETGGAYTATNDSNRLSAEFAAVMARLKHQYRLTWRSDLPADGSPHRATVDVTVASGSTAAAYGLWRSGTLEVGGGTSLDVASETGGTSDAGAGAGSNADGDDGAGHDGGGSDGAGADEPLGVEGRAADGAIASGPSASGLPGRYYPAAALAAIAALIGLTLTLAIWRGRHPKSGPRCVLCGRRLSGPGAPCPVHGLRGTYDG